MTRIPGGLIDRSQTLSFRFNGKSCTGHRGDTLASALLANGLRLMGRSFKNNFSHLCHILKAQRYSRWVFFCILPPH